MSGQKNTTMQLWNQFHMFECNLHNPVNLWLKNHAGAFPTVFRKKLLQFLFCLRGAVRIKPTYVDNFISYNFHLFSKKIVRSIVASLNN